MVFARGGMGVRESGRGCRGRYARERREKIKKIKNIIIIKYVK